VDVADSEALNTAVRAFDNLEESLFRSLELVRYGYTVVLQFDHLRLGRPVQDSALVTVTMEAVSAMRLVGALSTAMVQHPERINWGLSEVALVAAYQVPGGIGIKVQWENERSVTVEAAWASISSTPA